MGFGFGVCLLGDPWDMSRKFGFKVQAGNSILRFGFMGFGFQDLGFRLGFGFYLSFWFCLLGDPWNMPSHFCFEVQAGNSILRFGFWVSGFWVLGFWIQVLGFAFWVTLGTCLASFVLRSRLETQWLQVKLKSFKNISTDGQRTTTTDIPKTNGHPGSTLQAGPIVQSKALYNVYLVTQ